MFFKGSLPEWLKGPVLKTGEGESLPRVRIPELPPLMLEYFLISFSKKFESFFVPA
tara:strand:+ start:540 stop:707 length:168 start_codon:yes stop_codon:yes gene_type:complete